MKKLRKFSHGQTQTARLGLQHLDALFPIGEQRQELRAGAPEDTHAGLDPKDSKERQRFRLLVEDAYRQTTAEMEAAEEFGSELD